MLLGVHCSVAGGFGNAFVEAERLGIDTFQLFSRNQRQWKALPITEEEKKVVENARIKSKAKVIFSHCSYLINLGSNNGEIWEKSINALLEEIKRCDALGLTYCVLHPGSGKGQPLEDTMIKIGLGLKYVIENSPESRVIILLENTAGQGSSVGGKFENLGTLRTIVNSPRVGYCFDTCHAYAAGYDLRTVAAFEETMANFDKKAGLQHLKVFHLNDSKGELGSHLDRHEHIGKGKLGLIPFREILNRFPNIPKVLETAKEGDMDKINLQVLRNLI